MHACMHACIYIYTYKVVPSPRWGGSFEVNGLSRWRLTCEGNDMKEAMRNWLNEPVNRINEHMNTWTQKNQWTNECMNAQSLNQWTNESMNHRISEPANQWPNEPINQWITEWTNQWINEPMNQRISKSMSQRSHGWTNVRIDGRMDGWMDGWVSYFFCWATSSLSDRFVEAPLLEIKTNNHLYATRSLGHSHAQELLSLARLSGGASCGRLVTTWFEGPKIRQTFQKNRRHFFRQKKEVNNKKV